MSILHGAVQTKREFAWQMNVYMLVSLKAIKHRRWRPTSDAIT